MHVSLCRITSRLSLRERDRERERERECERTHLFQFYICLIKHCSEDRHATRFPPSLPLSLSSCTTEGKMAESEFSAESFAISTYWNGGILARCCGSLGLSMWIKWRGSAFRWPFWDGSMTQQPGRFMSLPSLVRRGNGETGIQRGSWTWIHYTLRIEEQKDDFTVHKTCRVMFSLLHATNDWLS